MGRGATLFAAGVWAINLATSHSAVEVILHPGAPYLALRASNAAQTSWPTISFGRRLRGPFNICAWRRLAPYPALCATLDVYYSPSQLLCNSDFERSVYEGLPGSVNDEGCLTQGLFKVAEINHPLVLSLSKDGRRWFDNLTMSGGRRTLKRPCASRAPAHRDCHPADALGNDRRGRQLPTS